ncbi:MAG TPA: ribose-phosphate diphosphokinase [Mycobacteriales bacterium]|nr:ribose-phosphate diphosphokinase [Mycobacteriales bacterium]
MSGLEIAGHKTLMLFSGRAYPDLCDEIAQNLDCATSPVTLYDFANSEIYCKFEESVRGCDAFVVQSHTAPVNTWLMEQLIMVDALKRASAKRITVVAPFYPYSRQDKKTLAREPITAKLVADLFRTAGANRIIAIDLHTPQIQGYFDAPLDHLTALPLLSDYLQDKLDLERTTIVSPDTGRVRTAEKYTDRLGGDVNLAFVHKRRDSRVPNEAKMFQIVGEVEGRTCVIVDDMIDTAGTITKAADALLAQGATEVLCAATHGVFSGPAIDRLKNSQISEVIVTNTLPITDDQRFDKLTVLSVAPIIAAAIKAVFDDTTVSGLFDGTTA